MSLPSREELLQEAYDAIKHSTHSGPERMAALARHAQALVAIANAIPDSKKPRDRQFSDVAQL